MTSTNDADSAAAEHRKLQRARDRADQARKPDAEKPMQAGARRYPEPPLPEQHQPKPGDESALDPEPMYDAPFYKGSEKLKDKVAVITGGDSGIGRAVAVLFAREGADIAIFYLNEHEDAETTRAAVADEGRACLLISGDVTDADFCRRAMDQVVEEFGGLDILVNNAAFQLHAAAIEDISEEQFEATFRTNIFGYFHMAKAALAHMREGGAVINTGSVTALKGSDALLDYSATKGAIHAFTKSLASQLIARNIRVNAVAPGPVWTPLNPADQQAKKIADFGAHTKMKRPAQPEEIAPAFVFLASPHCSSYITGEVLPVTGGSS